MEQSTQHPDVLAARRALSRPRSARLLVGGNGTPVHGVELIDRHGTPVLVCEPGSALAQASRDRRTATLTLVGDADGPVVVMRGRLSPLSADRIEDRDVELVELVLADVAVGDHGPVDLTDYLQEPPELLERYVADVLAHSNADHGAQLRGFAARVSGAPVASIAAASLVGLDRDGVTVRWVDLDGGFEVRVLFSTRAGSRRQLAAMLSQALCVHEDACADPGTE